MFFIIKESDNPITFAEICAHILQSWGVNDPDTKFKPTFQRSLRRALKGIVDDGAVMALGEGGPGDARRYCINPLLVAVGGTTEEYERAAAMLKADPGAEVACAKMMQAMRPPRPAPASGANRA
jgi:hypothetical protein